MPQVRVLHALKRPWQCVIAYIQHTDFLTRPVLIAGSICEQSQNGGGNLAPPGGSRVNELFGILTMC